MPILSAKELTSRSGALCLQVTLCELIWVNLLPRESADLAGNSTHVTDRGCPLKILSCITK